MKMQIIAAYEQIHQSFTHGMKIFIGGVKWFAGCAPRWTTDRASVTAFYLLRKYYVNVFTKARKISTTWRRKMANRFRKCSICGKRKRATIISITPSPYEITAHAEICIEICSQPPTKICNSCFHILSNGIRELLMWYFTPMKYSLTKRERQCAEIIYKHFKAQKTFKKVSKP